jgi:hypothetical protein
MSRLGMSPWDIARVKTLANGLADPSSDFSAGFKNVVSRDGGGYSDYGPDRRLDACFNGDATRFDKTPGRYSGTMRKVVQMLLGLGHPINYEYGATRTHGIWLAADGTPWVIEIGIRGIYAAPMPVATDDATTLANFRTAQSAAGYDLDFIPRPENPIPPLDNALTYAVENGTVLELAAASAMASFYALSPYFSACGWAFSYSGNSAQNTAWGWHGSGNPDSDFIEGYRFNVTIDGSSVPAASIAQVERGYLHGDRGTHFKLPTDELTGQVSSFDLFHGNFGSPPTPSDTTFYVFYDGETEKLCKYKRGAQISVATSNNIDGSGISGYPTLSSTTGLETNGTTTTSRPDEIYVNSSSSPLIKSFTGYYRDRNIEELGRAGWQHYSSVPGLWWISNKTGYTWYREYIGGGFTEYKTFIGVVPCLDREAFYIYRFDGATYTATTVNYNKRAWMGGDVTEKVYPSSNGFYGLYEVWAPGGAFSIQGLSGGESGFSFFEVPPMIGPDDRRQVQEPHSLVYSDHTFLRPTGTEDQFSVTLHASITGSFSIDSGIGSGDASWQYFTGSDYQHWQVVPDTMTGHRYVSKQSGGITLSGYVNLGVAAGYDPAATPGSLDRFFFGVP